jgi:hypothetical protein
VNEVKDYNCSQLRLNLIKMIQDLGPHRVAEINFSFNNGDVINLLKQRGDALLIQNDDLINKIDHNLVLLMKKLNN